VAKIEYIDFKTTQRYIFFVQERGNIVLNE